MAPISKFIRHSYLTTSQYVGINAIKAELAHSNAIVVLDEDTQAFLGVLTPFDLIQKPHNLVVDCLSDKPVLAPDCKIEEALEVMENVHAEVLPVINNMELEGLIYKDDLIRFLSSQKTILEKRANNKRITIQRQNEVIEKAYRIEKALYYSTKSARLLLAPDGTVLFFNQTAYESSGAPPISLLHVGSNLRQYANDIPHLVGSNFDRDFEKALHGESVVVESELLYKEAGVWLRTEYNPVTVENQMVGVSVVTTDISERKHNELFINRQNEVLREIIHTQSHVLRRPVANILGLVNLLNRKAQMEGEDKMVLSMLEVSTKELDDIIRDIVEKASFVE
ncbi:CBS domain-containing protein [Pontibacter silvestris]|uniref:histidine kinase n=1 Tax=Pontibacter silvestris TaxID=2305183 RepID=A0ABW4WZY4_9BACT|nr:CBS domain-containing protein [Pontibacter silvestris]MCC9136771.1 CBS domain-containing protein [Pontibacter silvestris]